MPKKVLTLRAFHGGLSSNSDPRDIADNELVDAVDIMVDEIGRIRAIGSNVAHGDVPANAAYINPGYGLFQFSHDRLEGETTGSAAAEFGDDYLAISDTDNAANVDIYSRGTDTWGTAKIDLGSRAGMKPCFYIVDGALRVSDGDYEGGPNTNQWYGYVDRTHFVVNDTALEPGGGADAYDTWLSVDSEIAAPTRGLAGKMYDSSVDSGTTGTLNESGWFTHWEDRIDQDADASKNHIFLSQTDNERAYCDTWTNAGSVETTGLSGSWAGDEAELYPPAGTGFNVEIFDDSTTVSPGVTAGTYELATTFIYDKEPGDITGGDQESIPFKLAGTFAVDALDQITFSVHATSPYNARITGGRVYMRIANSSDPWNQIAEISLKDGVRLSPNDVYTSWAISNGTTDATSIMLNHAKLYISELLPITYEINSGINQNTLTLSGRYKTAVVANRIAYIGNVQYDGVIYGDAIFKSPVNKFDIFTSDRRLEGSVSDGDEIVKLEVYADRLLVFKKTKLEIINISQELEFVEDTLMHKGVSHSAATCKTDFGIAWANKQGCYLYDGQKVSNLLEKQGRQIIKESDWSSFITEDSIIGYLPKKRQLIVLKNCRGTFTISGSIDPTASTAVTGVGTLFKSQVRVGDSICVSGEDRIIASIGSSTTLTVTSAFSNNGNDTSVVCTPDAAGDIYLFDIVTQSWVKGDTKFTDAVAQTNFVTDWNGDLIHAHTSDTGTVEKWDDTSATTSTISFKTKDIDFGEPSVRKKVYKVYVSYKGDGTAITINYTTNGDNDTYSGQFFRCNADGSTTGATTSDTPLYQASVGTDDWINAELKPTASITNIKSFQLKFDGGTTDANFEINDISIVYRIKPLK